KADYYKHTRPGGFSQDDFERINQAESESTLKDLVIKWAERTPFFDDSLWKGYQSLYPSADPASHKFWHDYRNIYEASLSPREKGRLEELDKVFFQEGRGEFPVAAM